MATRREIGKGERERKWPRHDEELRGKK